MMAPSSVVQRINDQLVAPRASRGELLVAYTAALAGSALATVVAADAGLATLPLVVVAVVALAGALITAAVPAALAWFTPVLLIKLLLGHLLPGEAAR